LRANGEVSERRRQATHPPRTIPELVATRPNEVWSYDVTKLKGPARGVYYDLFVMLDIYSRYCPGWMVVDQEDGQVAKAWLKEVTASQNITPGTLTIHADRGSTMTSKPVVVLLANLKIGRTHSRPHVSNDNPYSEAGFKTLKYCPAFPERFGSREDAVVMLAMTLMLAASPSVASSTVITTTGTTTIRFVESTVAAPQITWLTATGAAGNVWLLGDYSCAVKTCLAIFESENGGVSFTQVGAPPVRGEYGVTPSGLSIGSLLFADAEDGYAYSRGEANGDDSFFWTDDGGLTWQRVRLGGALAAPIVVSDGRAYAVAYRCRIAGCTSYELVSSPVTEDDWTTTKTFPAAKTRGENISLAAFGSKVWMVLTSQGGGLNGLLLVSRNFGKTFTAIVFSCAVTATSVQTLWGTCSGLHSSAVARSTDGGNRWVFGGGSAMFPFTVLLPLSDQEAVLLLPWVGPPASLTWNMEVTMDGGSKYKSVLLKRDLLGVGLATYTNWLALTGSNGGEASALLRTTNSGRTWQPVKAPSV
jgi:hypothetical protein